MLFLASQQKYPLEEEEKSMYSKIPWPDLKIRSWNLTFLDVERNDKGNLSSELNGIWDCIESALGEYY